MNMNKERKMPLFRFMLLRTFMPSALMLVVCVIFFSVLIARSNSHNDHLRLIHQQELAQQRLTETEDAVLRIVYRQQEILNSKDFLEFTYMYDDLDWYNRYRLQNALYEDVNALYLQNAYVQEAWLYWPDNGRTISSAHAAAATPEWLHTANWQEIAGFHRLDGMLISASLRDDPSASGKALIAVALDEDKIRASLQYILSDGGLPDIRWNVDPSQTQPCRDGEFVLSGRKLPMQVVFQTEDAETDQFVEDIMRITICVFLMMTLIVIISLGWWHTRIYQPLHHLLIDAFGQTEAGNFGYRISISQDSPFSNVYDSYNHMMQKMEGYIEKDLKQQVLVSRANLKQLQSQISPHFMYNSYYVLYRLLKKGDLENSQKLAEHLGHFYHYVTRNADDEKHLDEEVEHARSYASIQKFRFRDALDIEILDPSPVIAKSYVPRLILQPLLENAFKYAYESENASGAMRLLVRYEVRDAHDFDIIVENSGVVSDETLEAIRSRLESRNEQMETTALVNIHRRLQIYFGSYSRLEVERSDLGGLLVKMHIEDHGEEV